jgi:hypothetical protein
MMEYDHRGRRMRRLREDIELARSRIRTVCGELAEDQSNARRLLVTIARLDAQRRRLETVLAVEEILDAGDSGDSARPVRRGSLTRGDPDG